MHGAHPRAHHGSDHDNHLIVPFDALDYVLLELNS